MQTSIKALILALQFLTRLPMPALHDEVDAQDMARSLLAFPIVGLLIGILLVLLALSLSGLPDLVTAAVVLVLWVLLTGNLHLDGLADTADAWAGGQGDRDRVLEIMKDPRSGASAVSATVITLILKFAVLAYVIKAEAWVYLVLVPVLSRSSILLFFTFMDYVREQGLGSSYLDEFSASSAKSVLFAVAVASFVIGGAYGLLMAVFCVIVFYWYRIYWNRILGGFTGDLVGAFVEIIEALLLLLVVILVTN